jgi:DoxX-like family
LFGTAFGKPPSWPTVQRARMPVEEPTNPYWCDETADRMEMGALTSSPSSAVLPKAAAFSRRRTIIYWVVTLPILAETAAGIQWDLARNDYVKEAFDKIGFPYYFLTILGISKIPALGALLVPGFPRLKEWAYAGLVFVYFGAAALHIASRDGAREGVSAAIFGVTTLASWALRPPSRRDPAPLPDAWARLVARR